MEKRERVNVWHSQKKKKRGEKGNGKQQANFANTAHYQTV
jgi:hypothetical protein